MNLDLDLNLKLEDTYLNRLNNNRSRKEISAVKTCSFRVLSNRNILLKIDKMQYNVLLSETYPFGYTYINDIKYNLTGTLLIDYILSHLHVYAEKFNILVYCHPKIIDLDDEFSHFALETFKYYISKDKNTKKDIKIYSVDILAGGSFVNDGFSDLFIEHNLNLFDMIFIPDCGGIWYIYQEDSNIESFLDIINNVKKMLTENGILYISKIINKKFYSILENTYNSKFEYFPLYSYLAIKKH